MQPPRARRRELARDAGGASPLRTRSSPPAAARETVTTLDAQRDRDRHADRDGDRDGRERRRAAGAGGRDARGAARGGEDRRLRGARPLVPDQFSYTFGRPPEGGRSGTGSRSRRSRASGRSTFSRGSSDAVHALARDVRLAVRLRQAARGPDGPRADAAGRPGRRLRRGSGYLGWRAGSGRTAPGRSSSPGTDRGRPAAGRALPRPASSGS